MFLGNYIKRRSGAECNSDNVYLGKQSSPAQCADACRETEGCRFFIFGTGFIESGWCYYEKTATADCPEGWDSDNYDFYEILRRAPISKFQALQFQI